jgi:hypothetical protein
VPATLSGKFGGKFHTMKSESYYDSDLELIKYTDG